MMHDRDPLSNLFFCIGGNRTMEQTLGVDHGERFDRQESDDRGAEKERRVGRPFG